MEEKLCGFCAEPIKRQAIVCKHCEKDQRSVSWAKIGGVILFLTAIGGACAAWFQAAQAEEEASVARESYNDARLALSKTRAAEKELQKTKKQMSSIMWKTWTQMHNLHEGGARRVGTVADLTHIKNLEKLVLLRWLNSISDVNRGLIQILAEVNEPSEKGRVLLELSSKNKEIRAGILHFYRVTELWNNVDEAFATFQEADQRMIASASPTHLLHKRSDVRNTLKDSKEWTEFVQARQAFDQALKRAIQESEKSIKYLKSAERGKFQKVIDEQRKTLQHLESSTPSAQTK